MTSTLSAVQIGVIVGSLRQAWFNRMLAHSLPPWVPALATEVQRLPAARAMQ